LVLTGAANNEANENASNGSIAIILVANADSCKSSLIAGNNTPTDVSGARKFADNNNTATSDKSFNPLNFFVYKTIPLSINLL